MAKTLGKKIRQKIARDLVYYGLRVLLVIFRSLPYKLALALGAGGGSLAWYLLPYERKIARENLALAFPEKTQAERDQIARGAYKNLGLNLAEGIQLDKIRDRIDEYVEVEGWENFDKAREEGKGGIYITGHIGSWEMMAGFGALRGLPVTVIAKEVYDPRLDRLLVDLRNKNKMVTIHRDDPNITFKIAQVFAENRMLGILMDQDTRVRGVHCEFFGKKAHTPSGPAYLSLKFGIPIMGGYIYRMPSGKHKMVVLPPFHCESTGDMKADVLRETQRLNDMICSWIKEHPTEWVWFHRRYKTQPDDVKDN